MPSLTSRWSFDPSAFDLSGEAGGACNLDFELSADDRAKPMGYGTWWVLPFAKTTGRNLIGVRMVPGVRFADSPIVQLHGYEVETIASRPSSLVPVMFFYKMNSTKQDWEERRRLSDSDWAELEALHEALGGKDRLKALREVLDDDRLKQASAGRIGGRKDYNAALAEIFPRLDPTPETAAYRAYVQEAVRRDQAPTPFPEVGCWRAALAAVAYVTNRIFEGKRIREEVYSAWELVRIPPGLDSFQYGIPAHIANPTGESAERLPMEAPQSLVEHEKDVFKEWIADPMWSVVEALAEQGPKYNGLAHLDAAEALRANGQYDRVFTALIGAEYWRAALFPRKPFAQVAQAAKLLAEEHRWEEIAEGIAGNIEAAKQYVGKGGKKKSGERKPGRGKG